MCNAGCVCSGTTSITNHLHEGDEDLDHLVVLLKVVAVCIQGAVCVKGDEAQRLRRGVDLHPAATAAAARVRHDGRMN